MRIPKGGIAFFDSGIGGLTVLAACRKHLPNETFYYYGDNAHAPYGNRSEKQIKRFVLRAFKKINTLNVRAAVIACNTATTVCIEELRKRYSFPIVGTEPAVCTAAMKGGKVLVLATSATSKSVQFQRLCNRAKELFPQAEIKIAPCEKLAGQIERRMGKGNYDFSPFLPRENPTSVVLGCTHYIYIGSKIAQFYGCDVYDGNEGVARRLVSVLGESLGAGEGNVKENRDGRPLWKKFLSKLGFLTTFDTSVKLRKKGQEKRNICSLKNDKKSSKISETQGLFFLGKQRKRNEKVYKQMFVLNQKGSRWFFSG